MGRRGGLECSLGPRDLSDFARGSKDLGLLLSLDPVGCDVTHATELTVSHDSADDRLRVLQRLQTNPTRK